VKIACVGDSITYGAGIKDRERDSYPSQLAKMLGDGFQVKNFGVSGTTLLKNGNHPYWKTKAYHSAIEWQPQVVVIKLGTNDTKPGNWKHKDQVATDLKAMVAAFRGLQSKPEVILCLPVPAFPERWGIRDSVIKGELLPIIRGVAEEEKCPVIDLHKALDGKKQFFPDKVHPNKDGATVIAQTVHAELEKSKIIQPATTSKQ
jgi:acyl-CoA thioesterase-1